MSKRVGKQQNRYSQDFYWIPACNGLEEPFEIRGKRYQYMWNYRSGEHAYYCITDDVFLSDSEYFRLTHPETRV